MKTFDILGESVTIFADNNADINNKFNRAATLAYMFNSLESAFTSEINNPQSKVINYCVACLMLMHTGIRVGNEDSAEGYMTNPHPNQKDKVSEFVQTFGLTTLKKEHFIVKNDKIELFFLGKKSVDNFFIINHPVIVSALKVLLDKAGENDYVLGINDRELTSFIKLNVGERFSPKDFRCLRANILAWKFISNIPEAFKKKAYLKLQSSLLFVFVSSMLNNTPSVCKKNYVSPNITNYLTSIFI